MRNPITVDIDLKYGSQIKKKYSWSYKNFNGKRNRKKSFVHKTRIKI